MPQPMPRQAPVADGGIPVEFYIPSRQYAPRPPPVTSNVVIVQGGGLMKWLAVALTLVLLGGIGAFLHFSQQWRVEQRSAEINATNNAKRIARTPPTATPVQKTPAPDENISWGIARSNSAPEPPPSAAPKPPPPPAPAPSSEPEPPPLDTPVPASSNANAANVIFIGDSLIEGWKLGGVNGGADIWARDIAPLGAECHGFGGIRTTGLLERIKGENMMAGKTPKLVVILIGTNDNRPTRRNGAPDAAQTARATREIITRIHQKSPKTKVLIIGILPVNNATTSKWRQTNRATNAVLKTYADNKRIFYADLENVLSNPNGTPKSGFYHDDPRLGGHVHLRKPGYDAFAKAILPEVRRLLR
jgi:lysophospholipase L1-like esterase